MFRRLLTVGLGILALLLALAPGRRACAGADETRILRILRASSGFSGDSAYYTLRWCNLAGKGALYEGLQSLTWYYSTRPDGSDRKRLTTLFRDEFGPDFARRWRNEGAINLDWIVRRDGRQFLSVPGGAVASRAISVEALDKDVVVSTLVRPRDLKTGFSLALRVKDNGSGYLLTTTDKGLRFLDGAREVASASAGKISANTWYWYEVGLRTRKSEVMVRVRVYDETRSRLLASIENVQDKPANNELLRAGKVALSGPADFAEVYADPWGACWLNARTNELNWNITNVPEGKYFIIVEVADGKKPPIRAVSDFQVDITRQPSSGMARTPDP